MSTTWYLWSKDSDTNERIARNISEQRLECERKDVMCADGEMRDLLRCPRGYADVKKVIGAREKFNLKFEVFRENIEDVVVRYDLWKPAVRRAARVNGAFKADIRRALSTTRSRR